MPLYRLNDEQRGMAIALLQNGITQVEVARRLTVNQSVISRLWKRFIETRSTAFRHGGGRRRSTTVVQDRYIVNCFKRNPFLTARELLNQVRVPLDVVVSDQTIRNRLHDSGMRARRPALHPPLDREHRRSRLTWAQEHIDWTIQQWSHCLFTDESRFKLFHNDGRLKVWRSREQRYKANCMVRKVPFGGGSVNVWGGISLYRRTELVSFQNRTVTSQRYVDDILQPVVVPFAQQIGNDFILMDDNAPPHRARVVQNFLEDHGIQRMNWPARSPDLNPIEHIWDQLDRRVRNRVVAPHTLEQLEEAIIEEWNRIPQENIEALVSSMNRRCLAVISSRGGPTRY